MAPRWWPGKRRGPRDAVGAAEQTVEDAKVGGHLQQAGNDAISDLAGGTVITGVPSGASVHTAHSTTTVHGDVTISGGYVAGRDIHISHGAPRVLPRPNLLPRATSDFVNRVAELEDAARWADSGDQAPVIVLTGPAGVGKTALALRFCHGQADSHPDGALFADLGGFGGRARRTTDVLAGFLLALGTPAADIPSSFQDRQNLYRTMTARSRLIVLIDNASKEADVRELLPAGPAVTVVVTSRRRLAGLTGTRTLKLGTLQREAATGLLRILSRGFVEQLSDEALAQVASYCGDLPLALMIAGARLDTVDGTRGRHMISALGDERRRLHWLSAGDLEVRASFRLSYGQLPADEQEAFRLLSRMNGGFFSGWHLAALTGTTRGRADDVLTRLHDLHLVEPAPATDGCDHVLYRFHDLLRDFSQELFTESGESSAAPDARLIAAYRAIVVAIGPRLSPVGDGHSADRCSVELDTIGQLRIDDPYAWCSAEYANVFLVAGRALEAEGWPDAALLGGTLLPFLQNRCLWNTAEEFYALAREAADRLGDLGVKARLLLDIAAVRRSQARWSDSVDALNQCMALYKDQPASRERALALASIGVTLRNEGAWDSAWHCFLESRAVLAELDEPWGIAFATRGLGTVRQSQERWDEALGYFSETVDLFHAAGDVGREAMAWIRVGAVLRGQGRPGQALEIYERALPVFAGREHRSWAGITAVHQAAALCDLGEYRSAVERLDAADLVFDELDDRRWRGISQMHRGIVHRQSGRPGPALACLDVARAVFVELGDRPGTARVLFEAGLLFRSTGDVSRMREALTAAHAAFAELGSPRAETTAGMLEAGQSP
ncbi:tetratricopeptide repeat protein [Streptomyces sp. SID4982]|uniref:tetratricopeptide repeat protein n=1 Tax=Streptomyces sp. SID4982 TaxID=2690291 RepID=UPI0013720582|nr:tetratricopeptide repeat protein [Streptomyces sp. SID4982]MYS14419.1 tetratricopeptide repeat protein [Streptomyces sp. SID4982]